MLIDPRVRFGLLPDDWAAFGLNPLARVGDLLPELAEIWQQTSTRSESADATRRSLIELGNRGDELRCVRDQNGEACWLLVMPQHHAVERKVAILSSRLGRAVDRRKTWWHGLRRLLFELQTRSPLVLTSEGSTCDRFLPCILPWFGLRALRVRRPSAYHRHFHDWITSLTYDATVLYELPGVLLNESPGDAAERHKLISKRRFGDLSDRALYQLCDELYILHVRRNGNLHRLLDQMIGLSEWAEKPIHLCVGDELVPELLADTWIHRSEWVGIAPKLTEPLEQVVAELSSQTHRSSAPVLDFEKRTSIPMLYHWTRHASGPWPDESHVDYVRDQLWGVSNRDHSALGTLTRIVASQRLLATNRLTRGANKVVCWTRCDLKEFRARCLFRSHLGRWDFSPFGIGACQEWLKQRGTRPVIYGAAPDWMRLPDSEKVFFQVRSTRGDRSTKCIDWTAENEWRHVGDLDLSDLPPDRGLVFVPDRQAADQLARISPWPITVLPALVPGGTRGGTGAWAEG
jgi:hypothetical protein